MPHDTGVITCESFPLCGHEFGACPAFDMDGKRKCLCGVSLHPQTHDTLCTECVGQEFEREFEGYE